MKILVVGSFKGVQSHPDVCANFVSRLGELIVEGDHILLTGRRGALDKAIAEAAHPRHLETLHKESRLQIVGYRLKNAEPVHRRGTVHISAREDWEIRDVFCFIDDMR
ncbi:MAG TPA: hypothetical protein VMO00_00070 [Methylomirabilota bacterium]|nr:hypothetical protein [Methylomirabilota bacterium]